MGQWSHFEKLWLVSELQSMAQASKSWMDAFPTFVPVVQLSGSASLQPSVPAGCQCLSCALYRAHTWLFLFMLSKHPSVTSLMTEMTWGWGRRKRGEKMWSPRTQDSTVLQVSQQWFCHCPTETLLGINTVIFQLDKWGLRGHTAGRC